MTERRCVIYARQSLDVYAGTGDKREGLAVERQLTECRELAARLGFTIVREYVENNTSATRSDRPVWDQMMKDRPERIVVHHLDRFARRPSDIERALELGTLVFTVSGGDLDLSTPAGRAVARTVVAWAAYEGEQKAVRMRAKIRQKRAAGEPLWARRPFGYRMDGTLEPDEAEALRHCYRLLDQGETVAACTRYMMGTNTRRPSGEPWVHTIVHELLHSPRNAALVEWPDGSLTEDGKWSKIIEPDEWRRIMLKTKRDNLSGRGQGKRKHLLSGVVLCGHCGKPVALAYGRSGKRNGFPIYRGKCGKASAPLEALDVAVSRAFGFLVAQENERTGAPIPSDDSEVSAAKAESRRLRERLDELDDMLATGELSRASYARVAPTIREQLDRAEDILSRAAIPDQPWLGLDYDELAALWASDRLTLAQRQTLIRTVMPRIEILPKRPGVRFDPSKHLRVWDAHGDEVHLGLVMAGAVLGDQWGPRPQPIKSADVPAILRGVTEDEDSTADEGSDQ